MRGSMKRKKNRAAGAGPAAGMKAENGTLRIPGPAELDHHSAEQICARADELVRTRDIREIIFDFSATVFCDSSGIGMLMGRYKIMQALGGTVKACLLYTSKASTKTSWAAKAF